MLNHSFLMIITETYREIEDVRSKCKDSDQSSHMGPMDEVEFRGLIGILYYRAMFNQNLESIGKSNSSSKSPH